MREAIGNLWDLVPNKGTLVITTNGTIKKNGEAVMGRGIALEANQMFPGLAKALGRNLSERGNHAHLLLVSVFSTRNITIWTMPVKHNWWEEADPELIVRSAHELAEGTRNYPEVWMPRPGCGNGRLKWKDVKPLIEPIFDNRYIVTSFR